MWFEFFHVEREEEVVALCERKGKRRERWEDGPHK